MEKNSEKTTYIQSNDINNMGILLGIAHYYTNKIFFSILFTPAQIIYVQSG